MLYRELGQDGGSMRTKGALINERQKDGHAPLGASVILGFSAAVAVCTSVPILNHPEMDPTLRSTIAFVSTRHDPAADPAVDAQNAFLATEIYLMNEDGTNARRLTNNTYAD